MASKKVRILVDQPVGETTYRANAVVEFDAAIASSLVKSGVADDTPEAVAYALEQNGGTVIKHGNAPEASAA